MGKIDPSGSIQTGNDNLIRKFTRDYSIILVVIVTYITFSILLSIYLGNNSFMSFENTNNILRQLSIVAVLSAGEYFVIVIAMIDLSVASTLALSGVAYAMVVRDLGIEYMGVGIVVALAVGCFVGFVNGVVVAHFKIPNFIATLGTQSIARGIVYLITGSYPITGLPYPFSYPGRGWLFGFPFPIYIVAAVYSFVVVLSTKKKVGRYLYAIGGNSQAAMLSGINVKKLTMMAFMLSGTIAAISGVIMMGRLDAGHPNAAIGYEFDAIISVCIGGVGLTGGKGKAICVMFGAVFIALLTNGLTMLGVDSNIQTVIKGIVFVAAVGVDVLRNRERN